VYGILVERRDSDRAAFRIDRSGRRNWKLASRQISIDFGGSRAYYEIVEKAGLRLSEVAVSGYSHRADFLQRAIASSPCGVPSVKGAARQLSDN